MSLYDSVAQAVGAPPDQYAGMRSAATLSPQDQANSDAMEARSRPQDIADLKTEIQNTKNPMVRQVLSDHLDKLTATQAPLEPSLAASVSGAINSMGNMPVSQLAAPAPSPLQQPNFNKAVDTTREGLAAGAAHLATGIGASIVGGYQGLAAGANALVNNLSNGGGVIDSLKDAANVGGNAVRDYTQSHTYMGNPGDQSGKVVDVLTDPKNPLNWIPQGADYVGGKVADVTGSPAAGAAVNTAINAAALGLGVKGGLAKTQLVRDAAVRSTAGAQLDQAFANKTAITNNPGVAAPSTVEIPAYVRKQQAAFEQQKAQAAPPAAAPAGPQPSPQVAAAIDQAGPAANPVAVARHTEASSLPIPVELTEGQATGDINLLSNEQNMRASNNGALAQRFNAQNGQLVQNANAIRDAVAPDVSALNHVESGQALIDSYKAKDAALSKDISAKYQALKEANGGQFLPLKGDEFVSAADKALAADNSFTFLPSEVKGVMDSFAQGGPMTYGNFENLRTILGNAARKAQRAGDGNAEHAVSVVRNTLESLPMSEETAAIKPIADAARTAARQRFQAIDADPAYKAAINDTTSADRFVDKFVVKGNVNDVKTMRQNLASDPLAGQNIAAGTVNFLKSRAGLVGDNGNFSQAGYNKAMQALAPKLDQLVPPEQARQLQTLGNVARYTQEQPRGSWVNNSNTFVAGAANAAKTAVEGLVNVKTGGFGGTLARKYMQKRTESKAVDRALKPGAGIQIKDMPGGQQ